MGPVPRVYRRDGDRAAVLRSSRGQPLASEGVLLLQRPEQGAQYQLYFQIKYILFWKL